MLERLAIRLERDFGMARAGAFYRKLMVGGYNDPQPAPTKWLLCRGMYRAAPLTSTGNPHYNLLPDVRFWRLQVRFHQRAKVQQKVNAAETAHLLRLAA